MAMSSPPQSKLAVGFTWDDSCGLVGCPEPHTGLAPATQTKHREKSSQVREHLDMDAPHSAADLTARPAVDFTAGPVAGEEKHGKVRHMVTEWENKSKNA